MWKPLHIAAKMGVLCLSKHIIEKTKVSSSGNSLMMAADGGSIEVDQFLLETTCEVNFTELPGPEQRLDPPSLCS